MQCSAVQCLIFIEYTTHKMKMKMKMKLYAYAYAYAYYFSIINMRSYIPVVVHNHQSIIDHRSSIIYNATQPNKTQQNKTGTHILQYSTAQYYSISTNNNDVIITIIIIIPNATQRNGGGSEGDNK